jgi:DNA-binding XRE family transcriptional regulator
MQVRNRASAYGLSLLYRDRLNAATTPTFPTSPTPGDTITSVAVGPVVSLYRHCVGPFLATHSLVFAGAIPASPGFATDSLSTYNHQSTYGPSMNSQRNPEERLGNVIRRVRRGKGMSQEQLAFESDLHRTYIGSVERGERNVSLLNIVAIACALNVTAAYLLREADL